MNLRQRVAKVLHATDTQWSADDQQAAMRLADRYAETIQRALVGESNEENFGILREQVDRLAQNQQPAARGVFREALCGLFGDLLDLSVMRD